MIGTVAVEELVAADGMWWQSAVGYKNENEICEKSKGLKGNRKFELAIVHCVVDEYFDISVGDGWGVGVRKDGTKHAKVNEKADETERQCIDGGWS